MSNALTEALPRTRINLTVDAKTLTFVERTPQELGLTGPMKSFRIVYPDTEVILWVIGELSGLQAFNVLQRTIRQLRYGAD